MQTNQAKAPLSPAKITEQMIPRARDATNRWQPVVLSRNEVETQALWLGDGHVGPKA